jgi:hypothetical protein
MDEDELDKEAIEEPIEDLEAPAENQGDVVGGRSQKCDPKVTHVWCKGTVQNCDPPTCVETDVRAV